MTSATVAGSVRPSAPSAPSLARLAGVELRKLTDTRAGVALLSIVLLTALGLMLGVMIAGEPADRTFRGFFLVAQLAVGVLLPVLGILAVTSEWSQRTAMTTFALEPRRLMVVAAKVAAVAVLVAGALVVCLVMAALVNVLASMTTDASASWSLSAELLGHAVVFQLAGALVGVAFGLVFLSSPLAIVLYYVLPTLWTVLTGFISALEEPAQWLDFGSTTGSLMEQGMTGQEWAQLGTSLLVWLVAPFVVGVVRVVRSELK